MPMDTPKRSPLPRIVLVVGVVSMLNDFASEMVIPLIPLLLVTVLAAGPIALGLIEGAAETLANLLKLWSGRRSDVFGQRRKPFILAGYLVSNLVRPLIACSGHWLMVLTLRMTDRVGKGLRTAPRDALIADSVDDTNAGRAYGYTRALDHSGAVLGALAAAAVLHWGTDRLDIVIALSAIPGLVTVGLVAFAIHEPLRPAVAYTPQAPLQWSLLGPVMRRYLLVLGLFAFGRIPETFLLLRGHELGLEPVGLLLLWAGIHTLKAVVSEIVGRWASRTWRRPFILAGWVLYAVALLGLGLTHSVVNLVYWGLILACYYGLTEPTERALMRDLARPNEYGTAFGWYHMLMGLAALPGGLMLGGLWSLYGSRPAFLVSAVLAMACALFLWRAPITQK